jgi:hypothetical protein
MNRLLKRKKRIQLPDRIFSGRISADAKLCGDVVIFGDATIIAKKEYGADARVDVDRNQR